MNVLSIDQLLAHLASAITVAGDDVTIHDETALPNLIDDIVYTAVFGEALNRDMARWLIWEIAQHLGIIPSSIHELYMAVGDGTLPANFTVPAMNVRATNYNMSRAIFRTAIKYDAGAMLFEIARSEMGYTDQRPAEYISCVLAAAIKEGYRGPVFVQGDHIQVSASRYANDADGEISAVKELIEEAIGAGFYNIDIDTSTLVDLSYPTLDEQQRLNYMRCAELTQFARSIEPDGITTSLGGEIGEVGHKNSTVEELHAFMDGYNRTVGDVQGISKISVQTGTSHGGVVLPDGTLADVTVDFETLNALSKAGREAYGLGGAVQHGASTLPPTAFGKFPEVGTIEIHLATNFMNIIYDMLPQEYVDEAYAYLHANHKGEWKPSQSEEQFIYKTRKKAIGPHKRQWWDLDEAQTVAIGEALQAQFELLFTRLNIVNTRRMATKVTTMMTQHRPKPTATEDQQELVMAADLND